MMGFRTLALTYLFGGLTFLPLLLTAILTAAWYLLPRSNDTDSIDRTQSNQGNLEELAEKARRESIGETAASGTFAVLRQYDFQAAVGALNARNNANANGNGSTAGGEPGATGEGSSSSSESVYQSMYRSVFVGNKNASNGSLLDADDLQQGSPGRRKPVPAHIMYIVLRHGHLMLYDSPAQVEVKHVISLAHHKVTLQAGKHHADEVDERQILESDLFIRRTAIVLTPVDLPTQQSGALKPPKPFYLFGASTIEKEDFYHALLSSRSKPPIPRVLDSDGVIKLQSTLHSSSLTPETRALNALLGRVFLGIHKTDVLTDFVRTKIEKKLARIQKPTFIPVLQIRSLDLGDAGPVLSNLKMRDLNISGDMMLSADMRYNGTLSITLLAVAKLDLGQRFKTRTIDLVLKATLQKIQGPMLLRIKPPPSNRIWFTFETMPELELRVEPVVSERKITYGFVLRAIEERVRTAFAEGLVKPNWDDVPMPFQDTRGGHARGGLWSNEGEEEYPELLRPRSARALTERNERTMSTPDLGSEQDTGISTGLSSNLELNIAKLRHSSTMPMNNGRNLARPPDPSTSAPSQHFSEKAPSSSRPPKPLRSSSITSPSPIVATDEQTVEPVRADDESLRPATTQRKLWRARGAAQQPQTQKDALEELRDLRDRAEQQSSKPSMLASDKLEQESDPRGGGEDATSVLGERLSDGSMAIISNSSRTFSVRSSDSGRSTAPSTSSSASGVRSQQLQQKKTTILAAAGAATNAARTWGWNSYQKSKAAYQQRQARQGQSSQDLSEPMGRGQPLPPPGMPLPGPQKGLWGGVGGSVRRKPIGAPPLPGRRPGSLNSDPQEAEDEGSGTAEEHSAPMNDERGVEDEFGTWQENPGSTVEASEQRQEDAAEDGATAAHAGVGHHTGPEEDLLDFSGADDQEERSEHEVEARDSKDDVKKKVPPPLPARRRAQQAQNVIGESTTPASSSSEDVSEAPALRVPESEARAIAAENSTPELASGLTDDDAHVNEAEGVQAEISGSKTSISPSEDISKR